MKYFGEEAVLDLELSGHSITGSDALFLSFRAFLSEAKNNRPLNPRKLAPE